MFNAAGVADLEVRENFGAVKKLYRPAGARKEKKNFVVSLRTPFFLETLPGFDEVTDRRDFGPWVPIFSRGIAKGDLAVSFSRPAICCFWFPLKLPRKKGGN